jgi:hypothetical protein
MEISSVNPYWKSDGINIPIVKSMTLISSSINHLLDILSTRNCAKCCGTCSLERAQPNNAAAAMIMV